MFQKRAQPTQQRGATRWKINSRHNLKRYRRCPRSCHSFAEGHSGLSDDGLPVVIGKEKSIKLITTSRWGQILALTAQKRTDVEVASPAMCTPSATMARILQMVKAPDGTLRVLVQGSNASPSRGSSRTNRSSGRK